MSACPTFPAGCGRYIRRLVQHAWRDERAADCLRFASPAEATWRLDAWRLGGWEIDINRPVASSKVSMMCFGLLYGPFLFHHCSRTGFSFEFNDDGGDDDDAGDDDDNQVLYRASHAQTVDDLGGSATSSLEEGIVAEHIVSDDDGG